MNATILCVGKLKEKWQADGCAEYLKRLSRYGKYEIPARRSSVRESTGRARR